MKKILSVFLPFAFCLLPLSFVSADYSQTLSDYKSGLEKYRVVYQDFVRAKNSYLKYQTLNSQTEALVKTREFLSDRDDVLTLYFNLLKEKLNLTEGIVPFEKSLKTAQIDSRLAQFAQHKESIPAVASLNDCVAKSDELEKDREDLEIEANKIHGAILTGKVKNETEKFSLTINTLTQLINQIKATGVSVDKLERWLLETNYKYELAEKKLTDAKNAFENLNSDYFDQNQKNFLTAKQLVVEGNQYLKEAIYNAKEALIEIKQGAY